MSLRRWDNDDELLADLADAMRTTQHLSDWIRQAGIGAYAWHDVDSGFERASIVYDSSLDLSVLARDGSEETYRTLLFEAPSASVQIEKTGERVLGQLIPSGSTLISLVSAGGSVSEAEVDASGCFCFQRLPAEPVRLRWRTSNAHLVSDWFRLW